MSRKYRPSSGTEGMDFADEYCLNCINERWTHFMDEDKECDKCQIWSNVMIYDLNDLEYPKEWIYGNDGKPTCTSFVKWDWGNSDEGWNLPEPPSNDPNQLLMPFDIWQLLGITDEIIVTKGAIVEKEIIQNVK